MPQNFLACDREQELLLPPSLREWLPEDHLAWFVIEAVAQLDLTAFYAAYRADGHGRAAHDPAMMVALLLYCYAIGERSSRRIERRCVEDVATRVICANQVPDHTTIARFRQRHEAALAGLFGDVLALCAEAGLVRVDVVAVDGTKVAANAAPQATRDYAQIAREILAEADAVDAAEVEQFGDDPGDELLPELATAQGRRGWLREAKRRLEEKRAEEARRIPRERPDRLREAKRRLEVSVRSAGPGRTARQRKITEVDLARRAAGGVNGFGGRPNFLRDRAARVAARASESAGDASGCARPNGALTSLPPSSAGTA